MPLLTARIFQTIGRWAVTEVVSAEVALVVVSPASIESPSETVSTIVGPGAVAVALSIPVAGGTLLTAALPSSRSPLSRV
jgi:hypothetical protein